MNKLKTYLFFTLLGCSQLTFSQGIINLSSEITYGPCYSFLNVLGYHYTLLDLKKDSVVFKRTASLPSIKIVFDNSNLKSITSIDTNDYYFRSSVVNGTGTVFCLYKNGVVQSSIPFSDGKISGLAIEASIDGRMDSIWFKDNLPIRKVVAFLGGTKFVEEYQDGMIIERRKYGLAKKRGWPKGGFIDTYKGKLSKVVKFENGKIVKEIFYNIDGSIKEEYESRQQVLNVPRISGDCP